MHGILKKSYVKMYINWKKVRKGKVFRKIEKVRNKVSQIGYRAGQ